MKKLFMMAALLAAVMVLAGCRDPNGDNGEVAKTTLTVNNLSDFSLLGVEYSGVEFGGINSGKDTQKTVSAGTKYIFFSLETTNGKVRCKTAEAVTIEENEKSMFTFTNNTLIMTAVTDRTDTLRNLKNTLDTETPNPKLEVQRDNYPVSNNSTVNFDKIQKGAAITLSFTLINKNEHDLQITGNAAQKSGSNAAQVNLTNYSATRLEYNATASFTLTFLPTTSGINTFTITIKSNDPANDGDFVINFTGNVLNTWEKLYGATGGRYGTYYAVSNQEGGLYAGGYTSNTTAAIFNFDQYGTMKNQFTFEEQAGTVGPEGMGSVYNDFYSVLNAPGYGYSILKATSPGVSPTPVPTSLNVNNQPLDMAPRGIIKDDYYYYVAGHAVYYTGTVYKVGIFVNRHYSNGTWEKGTALAVPVTTGIDAESFRCYGVVKLINGDILLYGYAQKSGRNVAFLCAVNISAADSGSWTVRWSKTYEISNKNTFFQNYFIDDTNLILLGSTGTEPGITSPASCYAVKIPLSVSAAPTATAVTFGSLGMLLFAGTLMKDDSGYVFVGAMERSGTNGGEDVLIMKTNKALTQTIWSFNYGGTGNDWGCAFIEVNDGFIISGVTTSPSISGINRTGTEDIYLLKVNLDGTMDD
jgi:hypothetical protein